MQFIYNQLLCTGLFLNKDLSNVLYGMFDVKIIR